MSNQIQTSEPCDTFITTIRRETMIRDCLIIYGNVQDIFYDAESHQYMRLAQLLNELFSKDSQLGFTLAGIWDNVDGIRFGDDRMLKRFQSAIGANNHNTNGSQNGHANTQQGPLYPDPQDLLAAMRAVIKSKQERSVFIIDHSHLLVTQPDHPDPAERQWIGQLIKAIMPDQVVAVTNGELRQKKNLVVLLTTNLGNIPPIIYQGNPQVRLITATVPSRSQRKAFFVRHIDDLRCQQPKASAEQLALGAAGTSNREMADTLADLTDQLKMIDLKQILSLSLSCEQPLPPEKLLNLYRFGEQRSPWEELSYDKLRQVDETLKRRVIGQDHAVTHAATMIIRAYLGLAGLGHSGKRTKPKGTLFFVGPTGVGKTELARAIAEFLFGDESACIRFDMSEYNHEHSDQRLVGAPPGYVGFEEGGQLTNAIRQKPFSVLLFDEIEKAHGRILDKFLQIIEDGRLTDGRGETAHFSECIIIFTSNIGAAQLPETEDSEIIRQHFITSVEEHFVKHLNRPELLNRIGENIVVFGKITDPQARQKILKKQVTPLHAHLAERFGINLAIGSAAEQKLLSASKIENGGRGIINTIEHKIINPCSRFLFEHFHQLRKGRKIEVENSGDKMTFELKEGDTKP